MRRIGGATVETRRVVVTRWRAERDFKYIPRAENGLSLAHLSEVHFKKAESALEHGDLAKARELFEKALSCAEEGTANAALTRTALGSVLSQQGSHDEAKRI